MTKDILLVEYDEATVQFIRELLPPPLFELTVAHDGETAKRKLAGKNFDMMITAAMLPRFHGFNLALSVAQDYPLVKIIVISAIYKGFYYKHQAISQYRADDFFEKPLDKEGFRARVFELLNISASDLQPVAGAGAAQSPAFDTAKIQAPARAADEEKQLSADDIFGDLIKNIDKVPQHRIDLNSPRTTRDGMAAQPVEPPAPTPAVRMEPQPAKPAEKPDPGKTMIPRSLGETRIAGEPRKPAANGPDIGVNLDSLRQTVIKPAAPESKMRKIEDDIAKRFEDTLSGLGLGLQPPKPAPKPSVSAVETAAPKAAPAPAKPAPVVEPPPPPAEEELIIELGSEALQVEAPAAPAAEVKKTPERVEAKPQVRTAPAENPNELGDYVLLGMIARGGMAEIYKAKRKGVKGFEKVIAIKKILSGYGEDDKYIEMLVDEAKIAAELSHPNIIQIYDLGRKDNYYFIAMEYVLGKDLREIQGRLREKDQWFPEEVSLFLTIKILEALNYAHKAKDSHGHALEIVHRDVSPPNILISYHGDVKLTDFGISKASIKMHHTISGALKGKLLYMSPEQARGEGTIDCRSDLYSVGVVLFELLTGRKLFLDTSEMGVLKKVQNGEIMNPREINPEIDPALEKIILKSLNQACDKRYQSAAAMIADLETYMVKKYNTMPGPVHLSHFIYHLFEKEIVRDGIKVDLKPLPEKPLLRDIPKVQPEPAAPPPPMAAMDLKAPVPAPPPPPTAATLSLPRQAVEEKRDEVLRIDFDEEKIVPARKAPAPASAAPEKTKPASMFSQVHQEKEKRKFPLWPVVLVLLAMAAAAVGYYFLVLKGPDATQRTTAATPAAAQQMASAQPPPAVNQAPLADLEAQAAQNQKREEELKKQLEQAAAEEAALKQKIQDEKRARQLEDERQKKAEEERLRQEEEARLQKEEEQRRQEESDRQAREALEKKKAEEQKELERKRVKEGDVVPLGNVDKEPQVLSKPDPIIPALIRSTLPGNQTVRLNLLINQNGDVEVASLLQKTVNSQLNGILIDTIKTWKYSPAVKDGVRVKVWKTVSLIIKK